MTRVAQRVAENPLILDGPPARIQLLVTEPEGAWAVEIGGSRPSVREGRFEAPDATVTMADANLRAFLDGKVGLRYLYLRGEARVDGDVWAAKRLIGLAVRPEARSETT